MMKKLSISILLLMAIVISFASTTIKEKVYFQKAKDSFMAEELDANVLNGNLFYLTGYADSEGDEEYNLALSKRRVESVQAYLLSKGIPQQNIHVNFFGERGGESFRDMKENRVVEITYIIDPIMQHQVEVQEYPIENKEESIITGKHGTVVKIPAGAFTEDNVVISLKEYYNPLEIMSANLSTTSNGELLETGGMVYIEALSNGSRVNPVKNLEFTFEAQKEKEDFQLFAGEVDESLNVNWVPEEASLENPFNAIAYESSGTMWNAWFSFDDARAAESVLLVNSINPILFKDHYSAIRKGRYQIFIKPNGEAYLGKVEFPESNDKEIEKIKNVIFGVIDSQKFSELDTKHGLTVNFNYVFDREVIEYAASAGVVSDPSKADIMRSSASPTKAMSTRSLGWINCDRYRQNNDLVNFKVEVAKGVNVRMIVKEYQSYFNSRSKNGKYEFANIPNNKDVYLVAVVVKEDQYLLAIEDVRTSKEVFTDFKFQAYTYDEMIEKLGEIKL